MFTWILHTTGIYWHYCASFLLFNCNKTWKKTEFTIACCLREAAFCFGWMCMYNVMPASHTFIILIEISWFEVNSSFPNHLSASFVPPCRCLAKQVVPPQIHTIGSSKSRRAVFSLLFKTSVVSTQFGSVFEDDKTSCTPRAAFKPAVTAS